MEEKISGKVSRRKRKIAPLLEELKKGDVILLSEFSRLGPSMLECMEIISIAVDNVTEPTIYNWIKKNSIKTRRTLNTSNEAD